jgi:hypothetical protein
MHITSTQQRQLLACSCFSWPVLILMTGLMTLSLWKICFTSRQIAQKASSTPYPVRALTYRNITGPFGVE